VLININCFLFCVSVQTCRPDGPWQAVRVMVGSQSTPVPLYPRGSYASLVPSPHIWQQLCYGMRCYQIWNILPQVFHFCKFFGDEATMLTRSITAVIHKLTILNPTNSQVSIDNNIIIIMDMDTWEARLPSGATFCRLLSIRSTGSCPQIW
jgi:hypothetical protein